MQYPVWNDHRPFLLLLFESGLSNVQRCRTSYEKKKKYVNNDFKTAPLFLLNIFSTGISWTSPNIKIILRAYGATCLIQIWLLIVWTETCFCVCVWPPTKDAYWILQKKQENKKKDGRKGKKRDINVHVSCPRRLEQEQFSVRCIRWLIYIPVAHQGGSEESFALHKSITITRPPTFLLFILTITTWMPFSICIFPLLQFLRFDLHREEPRTSIKDFLTFFLKGVVGSKK